MENDAALPHHWEQVRISDFAELISGQHILTDNYHEKPEKDGVPYLTGPADFGPQHPSVSKWTEHPKTLARKGDVLVTVKGANVGKTNILQIEQAAISRQLMAVRPERAISKYVYYFFKANFSTFQRIGAGSTVPGIDRESILNLEVPLPPLPEQRRIVAKIEELFSNLDAGMADLQTAQRQLERYRLSVLQAAVEGRLTAAWRRTHAPEPADALLDRILDERKKRWYKSRYSKPEDPDLGDNFPEPPEGWVVTSFDSVLSHVTSGPRGWSEYYHEGDGVFVLAQNVRPGRLDLSETKNVDPPEDASGRERAKIQKDDLLVTIVGANTGDVCRVDRDLDNHWVCQSVALMRPAMPVLSKYLDLYLNSQTGQRQYERFAYGQGRPHLNFGHLKATPVLLPPLAEQKQIVAEVERLLSVADDAVQTAEREHTRAERLRQSILKQAFSGQLVPHENGATSAPAPSGNGAQRPGEQIELEL